jgi:pimeloyl-ACP methyl ester carboxylesterase
MRPLTTSASDIWFTRGYARLPEQLSTFQLIALIDLGIAVPRTTGRAKFLSTVKRLARRAIGAAFETGIAKQLSNAAVRRFGGQLFLGDVVRIMVDCWGMEYRDVAYVLRRLPDATPTGWALSWGRCGEYYAQIARHYAERGSSGTARAMFARASLYYHVASYVLVEDSDLRQRLHASAVLHHHNYGALCAPPIVRLAVPYQQGTLHAYICFPGTRNVDTPPWPVTLVVPGLGSAKEQPDFPLSALLERGHAVCVLDLPGHGESRAGLRLEIDSYRAISTMIDTLPAHPDIDGTRVSLLGVSLGAAAALCAAAEDDRVRAVVALSPFYEPRRWYAGSTSMLDATLRFAACDSDGTLTSKLVAGMSLRGRLQHVGARALVVHGDRDAIIPVEDGYAVARELPSHAELRIVKGGDHGITNVTEVRQAIADWLCIDVAASNSTNGRSPSNRSRSQANTPIEAAPLPT